MRPTCPGRTGRRRSTPRGSRRCNRHLTRTARSRTRPRRHPCSWSSSWSSPTPSWVPARAGSASRPSDRWRRRPRPWWPRERRRSSRDSRRARCFDPPRAARPASRTSDEARCSASHSRDDARARRSSATPALPRVRPERRRTWRLLRCACASFEPPPGGVSHAMWGLFASLAAGSSWAGTATACGQRPGQYEHRFGLRRLVPGCVPNNRDTHHRQPWHGPTRGAHGPWIATRDDPDDRPRGSAVHTGNSEAGLRGGVRAGIASVSPGGAADPRGGSTTTRQRAAPARPLKSESGGRNKVTTGTRATTSDLMADEVTICKLDELPEGAMRLVEVDGRKIGVFHTDDGELYAIEDRCSHDDGPLAEGEFDAAACTVECPRHGSLFDLRTGRPKTLPAFQPVDTFDARVEDGEVKLEV